MAVLMTQLSLLCEQQEQRKQECPIQPTHGHDFSEDRPSAVLELPEGGRRRGRRRRRRAGGGYIERVVALTASIQAAHQDRLPNAPDLDVAGRERPTNLASLRREAGGETLVVVDIINDGDPIPLSIRSRLFDRFYRADSSRDAETETSVALDWD